MKVLGIIAEYNPFHNGHSYHLSKSMEVTGSDVSVAVMSGNFVQRGEPAIVDKWIRSEMAVRNGVDLVFELPFVYACNNAEMFARGSISLFNSLNSIDSVCFGSESGDMNSMVEVSNLLVNEPGEFSSVLKEKMKEGVSFPRARQEAVSYFLGSEAAGLLESPNNILGIEYLKQIKRLNSNIKPYTISRYGAGLDDKNVDMGIAGATAIRKMIHNNDTAQALSYMPENSRMMMDNADNDMGDFEEFRDTLIYSIISKSSDEIKDIYSITEGLENRVIIAAKESSSVNEMINYIKSKRYTETRIKRILIHILMNLKRKKMNDIIHKNQLYTRVLAFNDKGSALLKDMKNNGTADIPIITNISKESDNLKECTDMFNFDILASDIYNLVVHGGIYDMSDYRRFPAYIKDNEVSLN